MSIKAFFVDFYGTIVHEDGEVITKITDIICKTGKVEDTSEVDTFWWKDFQIMFMNSFGDAYETQRQLEERSLVHTLERFGSDADAKELSNMMFAHWIKPFCIFITVHDSPKRKDSGSNPLTITIINGVSGFPGTLFHVQKAEDSGGRLDLPFEDLQLHH